MHYSLRDKFAGLTDLPLNLDMDVKTETETIVVKNGATCAPNGTAPDGMKKKKMQKANRPAALNFDR